MGLYNHKSKKKCGQKCLVLNRSSPGLMTVHVLPRSMLTITLGYQPYCRFTLTPLGRLIAGIHRLVCILI